MMFRYRLLVVVFVGATACAAPPANPVVPSAAAVQQVELARVKIGTDLYAIGYGWLDGLNFTDASTGPFMVYGSDDAADPDFWYYKGAGIVPIGTTPDEAAKLDTQSTAVETNP